MATESVKADLHDGETGPVEGMSPLDRTNRISVLAMGLGSMAVLMDSAIHAPAEHQSTPQVWSEAFYFMGVIAREIAAENSAAWEQVKPWYLAAREVQA